MKNYYSKYKKYSIRKLLIGTCSIIVGIGIGIGISTNVTCADELSSIENSNSLLKNSDNISMGILRNQVSESVNSETSEIINPSNIININTEKISAINEENEIIDEDTNSLVFGDRELKPREIKLDQVQDILNWEPDKRADDELNKGAVALSDRYQGEQVVNTSNPEAKVQALSNTNSKAIEHSSVGGDEFKTYAFDYWQYLDSMVFWEGLIPTPDVIDVSHRNGVPILGTIFFDWSNDLEKQKKVVEFLKQDKDGSFPVAKKLVDIAKYYGFDGYFINQETSGKLIKPLGEKMREFMLYSKSYSQLINYPIKLSWYDAMTYKNGRNHQDGLSEYNSNFFRSEQKIVPSDTFFVNFNWNEKKNNKSIEEAKKIGRSPFDIFAGLELQQGGSYHTKVDWKSLVDNNGKLKLSIGLFAPDTITSLGQSGEDYHENENIFWNGYNKDILNNNRPMFDWFGLSHFIADKTPIISKNFSTSFNTGHGKMWFVDGLVKKDSEWNYRSVGGYLPTWRWWIVSKNGSPIKASYDFLDAYNGGNSLKFNGHLNQNDKQNIMLYSTHIPIYKDSFLNIAHKYGVNSKIRLGLFLDKKYQEVKEFQLNPSSLWKEEGFNLSELEGKIIYGIRLTIESSDKLNDFKFNLGQISIYDRSEHLVAPRKLEIRKKILKNSQDAEAIITFKGDSKNDYYEIYAMVDNNWELVTASSNTVIYIPHLRRSIKDKGTIQGIRVVAVGKNGQRITSDELDFDWGIEVSDTEIPKKKAENIVKGAKVSNTTFIKKEGNESIESMLNGTITSLSDKFSSSQLSGVIDIHLTEPRNVIRWVMEHAGAGGESVKDGLMNTKDFDLYYKDESAEWKLAKSIRNNILHITDVVFDKAITAQDWRLKILTSDNGTPWKAVRIYNWKMFEELDTQSENIPMADVVARRLDNNFIKISFREIPKNTTVNIYDSRYSKNPIMTLSDKSRKTLLLNPVRFSKDTKILYYRAKKENKEYSNLLAIPILNNSKGELKDKSVVEAADYSALQNLLSTIPSDLSGYTEESVTAFLTVAQKVSELATDLPKTEQSKVDEAAQTLKHALQGLKKKTVEVKADYSALQNLLSTIPSDLSGYTEDSVRAFLTVAQKVSELATDLPKTEQSKVDEAVASLQNALTKLVKAPEAVVHQVTPTEGEKAVYVNKPELVLSRESIAYKTIEQVNPNLPKGERHVQVKGELGERLLVKEVVKVGDNVISSQDLPSLVTKEAVDEVVEVGSREVLAGTDGTISTNTDSYQSSFLPSQLGKEIIPSKDSKESMRQDKEVSTEVEKPIYSRMERYHSDDTLPNTGEQGSGLFFVGMSLLGLGMVSKKRRRG